MIFSKYLSDELLMKRYAKGSEQAFEILYKRHKNNLFRYFMKQCYSKSISEELYQDTWMKIINTRHRYEAKAKFTTWLYLIGHQQLISFYRRSSNRVLIASYEDESELIECQSPGIFEQVSCIEKLEQVERCVKLLSAQQREIFLLKVLSGLTIAQIAEILATDYEVVKSRYRYALSNIKKSFDDD